MNDNLREDTVRRALSNLLALSHEELQRELNKHQHSDFATLFRLAREWDDNFMRSPEPAATTSPALPAEFLQQLEQWINLRIEQQVKQELAKVLPQGLVTPMPVTAALPRQRGE